MSKSDEDDSKIRHRDKSSLITSESQMLKNVYCKAVENVYKWKFLAL